MRNSNYNFYNNYTSRNQNNKIQIKSNISIYSGVHSSVSNGFLWNNTTILSGGSLTVSNDGQASGIQLEGGTLSILQGGYTNGTVFGISGGTVELGDGVTMQGVASNTVKNGGILIVQNGATLLDGSAGSNGSIVVQDGGLVSGTQVNGGTLDVYGGGTTSNTSFGSDGHGGHLILENGAEWDGDYSRTIPSGGSVTVKSGAELDNGVIGSGVTLTVSNGGLISTTDLQGGTLVLHNGAQTADTSFGSAGHGGHLVLTDSAQWSGDNSYAVPAGGSISVESGAVLDHETIGSGVTLTVSSGGQIGPSGVTISSGGTAILDGTSTGGTVTLADSGAHLVISGMTMPANTISGFGDGTQIDLASIPADSITSVTTSGNILSVHTTDKTYSLTVANVGNFGTRLVSDGHGGTYYEACYCADTLILTDKGERPVQDLQPGDHVIAFTDHGKETREIVWAGHKQAQVRAHLPLTEAGYPVRIVQNALQEGVPHKDMLITPEHCLFMEGAFIPVRMLVNGRSIFFDTSVTDYTYYHIETDRHSVIQADGALSESFLNTGNKAQFAGLTGCVRVLYETARCWANDAAATLETGRLVVEPIYQALAIRAEKQAFPLHTQPVTLTDEADLHLETASGLRINPQSQTNGRMRFMLPAQMTDIRLVSRAGSPAETVGPFVDDRRQLGVCVGQITLIMGNNRQTVTTHLEADHLPGWHAKEDGPARWTDGNALLPLGVTGQLCLQALDIEILSTGRYPVTQPEFMTRTRRA